MKLKHLTAPVAHFKVLDEALGIVECIPSVFEVRDSYNEQTKSGCFVASLARKMPTICWMHDQKTPVGKTLEARELSAGDPMLPAAIKSLGGLYCKGQFNLETQRGREAFSDVKFGSVDEWSIGYYEVNTARAKDGSIDLLELDLVEFSPVLRGANPATVTLGIKSLADRVPECKGAYLGDYVEGDMLWSALWEACYALMSAIYDCCSDDAPADDLNPILEEFSGMVKGCYSGIMAMDNDMMEQAAGEMSAALASMKQKGPSLADGSFTKQLDSALAAVTGCLERGKVVSGLRAKDSRVLSEERCKQLEEIRTATTALLEQNAPKANEGVLISLKLQQLQRKARMREAVTH